VKVRERRGREHAGLGMRSLLREEKMCFFRMQNCLHLDGYFKKFRDTDGKEPEEIEQEVICLTRKYAVL